MSRERPPPQGPKGMRDPPSGPRAGGYAPEFRSASRGRGRGRGGFRDDSRDRGRDLERGFPRDYNHRDDRAGRFRDDRSRERDTDRDRDYRNNGPDRRDTRGRGGHFYRAEQGRDREWRDRDAFRPHNASPQLRRSRSPDLRSTRDSRDGHLNLDLERTQRASRDGPLSAGSSSSDPSALASTSQPNRGGYGRGRGYPRGDWDSHGGGRARYSEDRFRGRSRSQDRETRDLVRGRGDMRNSRDERNHRDDRGPEMSRAQNERRPSSWNSPVPTVTGPSPSSVRDDSRREEGEINREPRNDIVPRRIVNSDLVLNRGAIFATRPNSQSPPSLTEVPAFGSVTGRPAPPPSAPTVPAQAPATAPSLPAAASGTALEPVKEKTTPTISTIPISSSGPVVARAPTTATTTTPVSSSGPMAGRTPIATSATPVSSGPRSDRTPLPTSTTPTSAYVPMTGRAPPTAPKADRSKSILESPVLSHHSSFRTGSNAVFPQPTRIESQDAQNPTIVDGVHGRGAGLNTPTSRPAILHNYPSTSQPDRIFPPTQLFAGQKHSRSDSDQDALHGPRSNTSMPAPLIPTEPRADRVRNTSSPSNTNKTRYIPSQKVPASDLLVPSKPRDSRVLDMGQNQIGSNASASRFQGSGAKPTTQSGISAPVSPRRPLQKLMEVKARNKLKQYALACKASRIGDESKDQSHPFSSKSATTPPMKPLITKRPLEIDSKVTIDEDNASDSDSGDDYELDEEYFEAQNSKLTAELAEVERITKPQEQLFPPCDLTIDNLAFAEIHDVDITIISDLSSKQSSLAPITKNSPTPIMNPSPIPIIAQDLAPKSESTDLPMASPKPLQATTPPAANAPPEEDGAPVTVEKSTPQPEMPVSTGPGRRTPSPSCLVINPDALPFDKDPAWLKSIEISQRYRDGLKHKMRCAKQLEQENIRKEQAEYVRNYKLYLQMVADLDAEKPRNSTYKADLLAAKDAKRASAAVLSIEARPEGGRSTRNSHQSQLELEAVLRASEQEAQDLQKKFDNKAQSKPNYAVEAVIPDQFTPQKQEQTKYFDRTGLVPFRDTIEVFGFGEFRTDFTPEERRIFEKAYRKTPKQWGIIAESLDHRDFHDCIAHYYAVKGDPSWPFKARKVKATKGRAGNKPRSKTLMADPRDPELDDQNDRQGRRVTRAAAAGSENVPSESETTTPIPASGKRAPTPIKAAPTPVKGRALTPAPPKKGLGSSKVDVNLAANPPEKKPRKASTRTTSTKKVKNNQAATPTQGSATQGGNEDVGSKNDVRRPRAGTGEHGRFAPGYEGQTDLTANSFPDFMSRDQAVPSSELSMGMASQPYAPHDNMGMMQHPSTFDGQPQDRRGLQSTSSYWSVTEQTDFPGLLRTFGTDWGEIAKYMASKTHIMVKNYYQRQIEQGKVELEQIATEADAKKAQGKKSELPPPSSTQPKRPYNSGATQQLHPSGPEVFDDLSSTMQSGVRQQASPSQPSLSSRFPALAQAGPVPQNMSETSHIGSMSQKHTQFPRPTPQAQQNIQQARPFNASPRGPPMGYFTNIDRERTKLPTSTTPQPQSFVPPQEQMSIRAAQAAQAVREAEAEQAQALRIEERTARERERVQMQDQQVQERKMQERQLQMKKESSNDHQNLQKYEQYSGVSQPSGLVPLNRMENRTASPAVDTRRVHTTQPYGSRNYHGVFNLMNDNVPTSPHIPHGSPGLAVTRTPVVVNTTQAQHYSSPATPVQPAATAPPRPPEPVRNVSIMSLLNDEPSEPRPVPTPRRVNEVASTAVPRSQSPNPQQPTYQPSRIQTTPSSLRREPAVNEIHNGPPSYHNPAAAQGSMRLVDSPYSAIAQPRSQIASPMDSPAAERDYYSSRQYSMQTQQLPVPPPQPGSSFQNHPSNQPNHRLLAFGQSPSQQRTASPPNAQYTSHLGPSRHGSFDGRQGGLLPTSMPPQQAFGSAHQHQGSPMPVHHQHAHQHPLQNSRFGGQQLPPSQMPHMSHSRPAQQQHYSQGSPHAMQKSVQAAAPIRSFTPSSYDSRAYTMSSPVAAAQQQQAFNHEQQSMLRRPMPPQQQQQQQQQQQDAAIRAEHLRQQHEAGYESGYRRGPDGYEQIYDERREDRRMDDTRR